MTTDDQAGDGALFQLPAAPATAPDPGDVERWLDAVVQHAVAGGRLDLATDGALVSAARVLARALDAADRVGGLKGGYLVAQGLPPFQRALHALRLPTETTAAPAAPTQPDAGAQAPDWAHDVFGTPS